MSEPLSIGDAAREAGELPAIITATRTLTFGACAHLAFAATHTPTSGEHARQASAAAPIAALVATPAIESVLAIYRALELRRPLPLLHPSLVPAELARQRADLVDGTVPGDAAFVLFTSGSTGRPRGVVLSRAAVTAAAYASAAHLGWYDSDRWLLCLPLAHAGGLSIVVRCLIARRPLVLLEGDFDPRRVEALVRDQRATLASLVPAQLAALELHDPRSLRAILLGGAAAPQGLVDDAVRYGLPVRRTYGLTETFGQVATAVSAGDAPIALPGVSITIAGAAPGRIAIRGPMLATSYLDGTAIAPELVTADLGTIDERGRLHVLGRSDDVIVTGGENVHPVEVEAVLAATPGVCAVCVFGVPDPRWGHVVGAAIVIDDRFDHALAVARWYALLPAHARPRRLVERANLPVLASGKLDRRTIAAFPTAAVHYGTS